MSISCYSKCEELLSSNNVDINLTELEVSLSLSYGLMES